jgi:DnaK suppressor protein
MTLVLNQEIVQICRKKLINLKQDLLNRSRELRIQFATNDKSTGDEIDQSVAFLAEHNFLVSQDRIRIQLAEIEMALARIETGKFGVCEETNEPIEADRLLAIPYTRLSVEGAELREHQCG